MPQVKGHSISYLGVAILVLSFASLVGCYPDHPQSTFDASGPVARSQLTLFYWIFWAAVFVFVTVGGALFYAVIRYRRKPGDPDPPQIHGHKRLEIAWTIAPALVLAVVAVPTVITIFDNANSPQPAAMTVDVVAHQWWWEFRYPHPSDDDETVVTANELHIPVDEVVNITLDSKDVLHSFWIPKIAGKVDVVPNNLNTMWITADEAGEYLGQCAEFCGVSHANMRFRVIAEPRAEFDAWLAAQAGPGLVPVEPQALEGKALFEGSAECWACHTVLGSARARGTKGPDLSHLASRGHIAAGLLENNQANLRKWLLDPNAVKPGNIMFRDAKVYTEPERKLTEAQVSALVAYLRSLK
jgi:cytochrome c oxidase subunit 2